MTDDKNLTLEELWVGESIFDEYLPYASTKDIELYFYWHQICEKKKERGKKKATISKPCPFCGSKRVQPHRESSRGQPWAVECTRCHTCGPFKDTKEKAIIEWNRRARI